jgi:hypothetical protein
MALFAGCDYVSRVCPQEFHQLCAILEGGPHAVKCEITSLTVSFWTLQAAKILTDLDREERYIAQQEKRR